MFTAASKIEFRNEFIVKIVTLESSRAKVISGYYEGDENRVRPWITDASIYNNGIYSSINKPIFPFRAINNIAARNLVRCFRRLIVHTGDEER